MRVNNRLFTSSYRHLGDRLCNGYVCDPAGPLSHDLQVVRPNNVVTFRTESLRCTDAVHLGSACSLGDLVDSTHISNGPSCDIGVANNGVAGTLIPSDTIDYHHYLDASSDPIILGSNLIGDNDDLIPEASGFEVSILPHSDSVIPPNPATISESLLVGGTAGSGRDNVSHNCNSDFASQHICNDVLNNVSSHDVLASKNDVIRMSNDDNGDLASNATHVTSHVQRLVSHDDSHDSTSLSSYDHSLLDMFIIIDNLSINTHISTSLNISHHMCATAFHKLLIPIINNMCNHKCDKISLNLTTWNTHGLLGSNSFSPSLTHNKKELGSKRLLTSHHITGLLEIHADPLECDAFTRKWNHSHVFFWSISEDRNCGGVVIALSKAYLSDCLLCFSVNFVPGRILGVFLCFPNVNIFVVCIHNSPTWTPQERYHHFRSISRCVPEKLHATTILCGDLNFSHNTIRFNNLQLDTTITNFHKSLASLWEGFFHDFVEVSHDCPTFMRGTYLSQLDHIFINIYSSILLDLNPSSAVVWEFGDVLGSSSDHTPLRLSIGSDVGIRVAAIPKWVPKHPDFKAYCEKLFKDTSFLPDTPFETLQKHKCLIKEAARLTIKFAKNSNVPLDIDQKIYWTMTLLRHRHDLSNYNVVNALNSYKHLRTFLSEDGKYLNIHQLCLYIDELQYTKATGDIASLPDGSLDDDSKRIMINRLGQYLTLWASRRRKISNLVIVNDEGDVSESASSAASMLSVWWSPKFAMQKVHLQLARFAILPHIKEFTGNLSHVSSYDIFCERISFLKDSGVGSDSFLYSC